MPPLSPLPLLRTELLRQHTSKSNGARISAASVGGGNVEVVEFDGVTSGDTTMDALGDDVHVWQRYGEREKVSKHEVGKHRGLGLVNRGQG